LFHRKRVILFQFRAINDKRINTLFYSTIHANTKTISQRKNRAKQPPKAAGSAPAKKENFRKNNRHKKTRQLRAGLRKLGKYYLKII